MKLTIQKEIILQALKKINNVVGETITTPVNDGVLIKVEKQRIIFKAVGTHAAIMFETQQGINTELEGEILVKTKLIYNIISKIRTQAIDLECVDNSVLRIKAEKFSSDINLFDSSLFPTINFQTTSFKKIQLDQNFIKLILNKLVPCATTTETRNIACNTILIDSLNQPNTIEAIGTDGNHLAYLKQAYEGEKFKLIIPTVTLKQIEGMLDYPNVEFFINNKNMIVKTDTTTLLLRTTEGEYPNLTKPLQSLNPNKIIINTQALIGAVDKVTLLALAEKKPAIQFNINNNMIKIVARSIEYGSAIEEIDITNPNNIQQSFTFNAKYLMDLLKNITTTDAVMEFSTHHKPAIFKEENNENYISLILPIMSL